MKPTLKSFFTKNAKKLNISKLTKLLNYLISTTKLYNFDVYNSTIIDFNALDVILLGDVVIQNTPQHYIDFKWDYKTDDCEINIFHNQEKVKTRNFNINDILV